jgi:hypothetical protein
MTIALGLIQMANTGVVFPGGGFHYPGRMGGGAAAARAAGLEF